MKDLLFYISIIVLLLLSSCKKNHTVQSSNNRAADLFNGHCAACHIAPDPKTLPKHLWKDEVLPDMGSRMGIYDPGYNPLAGLSLSEQEQYIKTGIYSKQRTLSDEDWTLLQEYIINAAPDSLETISYPAVTKGLLQFKTQPIDLDSIPGSSITYLDINKQGNISTANISGNLVNYTYKKTITKDSNQYQSPVTGNIKKDSTQYVTTIGILNPSEKSVGVIHKISGDTTNQIISGLHRPVYTEVYDFDKDGKDEILVSEFGHLTGALSLWKQNDDNIYEKTLLLDQPGIIRTALKDMDKDGTMDIVLLTSQGNEGIAILYQTEPLSFNMEQVLRFNPVYGTSWFEVIDYDNDGDDDIITVNGDNADKTYIHKPYHGMRIHINNGKNKFEEKYFYPMDGATRFVADDFDNDNDIDIAILSSFPDYENNPDYTFFYLENQETEKFTFKTFSLEDPSIGRWLLLDAGDIDQDGDQDIILSSFTYYFAPVPDDLDKKWKESNVDILVLENTLQ